MAKYKALKNLVLNTLNIDVEEGNVIELEHKHAEQVNKDLKLTFPDVDAVLVLVDETKPATRTKKADTKASEYAAEQ